MSAVMSPRQIFQPFPFWESSWALNQRARREVWYGGSASFKPLPYIPASTTKRSGRMH